MTSLEKTYRKLEEVANKHQLSGGTKITLTQSYGDECVYYTEDYRDDIFIESCFSESLSSILSYFPIDYANDVYTAFVRENPTEESHDQYMWKVGDEVYYYEEVIENQENIPGFDEAAQNIHEVATPTWDEDILSEWINENYYELCDTLEWDLNRYDHKRGYATAKISVEATLDQVMNISSYALNGWTVTFRTPDGTLTIE